jgi:hypothetical protein
MSFLFLNIKCDDPSCPGHYVSLRQIQNMQPFAIDGGKAQGQAEFCRGVQSEEDSAPPAHLAAQFRLDALNTRIKAKRTQLQELQESTLLQEEAVLDQEIAALAAEPKSRGKTHVHKKRDSNAQPLQETTSSSSRPSSSQKQKHSRSKSEKRSRSRPRKKPDSCLQEKFSRSRLGRRSRSRPGRRSRSRPRTKTQSPPQKSCSNPRPRKKPQCAPQALLRPARAPRDGQEALRDTKVKLKRASSHRPRHHRSCSRPGEETQPAPNQEQARWSSLFPLLRFPSPPAPLPRMEAARRQEINDWSKRPRSWISRNGTNSVADRLMRECTTTDD